MMLPLDEHGYYTIVVSRSEDRTKNATVENGVAWIDWGTGEGLDDPRDRKDWGMLLMRFMVCHPGWDNSPAKATKPGTEEAVMGSYYPKGYYTTKAEFEAKGVQRPAFLKDFTVNNTRGLRYAEIAMVGEKAITIYNSTGLSEAPPDQWNPLNAKELADTFQVHELVKNGPHWSLLDRTTFEFGEEILFGGMGFHWAATIPAFLAQPCLPPDLAGHFPTTDSARVGRQSALADGNGARRHLQAAADKKGCNGKEFAVNGVVGVP
jgi:hypothetical protein